MPRLLLVVALFLCLSTQAFAQANGKLQIHYIDVGQGDGAVLISPQGEVVLFDNGVLGQCGKPIGYLQSIGLTKVDYHVASHYHSDHIGCTAEILGTFPLQRTAYDRGGSYTTQTYSNYVTAVGARRATAVPGQMITLDAGSAHPVQILFVASNANDVSTTDENDRSLVSLVRFGNFEAVFGGDLSGAGTGSADPDPNEPAPPPPPPPPSGPNTCTRPPGAPSTATAVCKDGTYSSSQNRSGTCSSHGGVSCWICPGKLCSGLVLDGTIDGAVFPASFVPGIIVPSYLDIESLVAAAVGRVEVYKVHHHGSRYSSNPAWLSTTQPRVSVLSVGSANSYGHPTAEALTRLRSVGTTTYWTSVGNGAAPQSPWDVVIGTVVIDVAPGAQSFTVRRGATNDTFAMWSGSSPNPGPPASAPFGTFDTPTQGQHVAGEVAVTGWALDDTLVSSVKIYRNPMPGEPTQPNGLIYIGDGTFVAGARTDVASLYPSYPQKDRAGWGYMLLTNFLPNSGNGTFQLTAIATDDAGRSTVLGEKTIVVNNATNALPFGTIDTPRQGETVSGTIANFGWALTPQPKLVPTDGSTITVFIDGQPVGRPTYNQHRADIASLFPGYANANGAVAYFMLDTTTLTNGVHTIAWGVVDNQGSAQGIGSRYFTVMNPPSSVVDAGVCTAPAAVADTTASGGRR